MKLAIIAGTKAEVIKLAPVLIELERRGAEYYFLHTGQHNISSILYELEVPSPSHVLYTPPKFSSRFMLKTHKALLWSWKAVFKLRKIISQLSPDFVLYHGDTLSTSLAAISSSNVLGMKKWQTCHIEAGLRSFDLFEPFPEEISRRIADRFSDVLFTPSRLSTLILKGEYNDKKEIVETGNTIVDSVKLALKLAKKRKIKHPEENEYVVVNVHRHENITSKERLKKIVEILECVTLPIYWPLHDNTRKQLKKFGLWKKVERMNIKFSKLKGYVEFINLLSHATYILTDGGSIQEESLVLKKPCIILRYRTERQEGLTTGINFLSKLDVEYTCKIIKRIENEELKIPKFKNPYGDGKAGKRIVEYLLKGY